MLQAVIVTIDVKPEFRERFIEESRLDAEGSVGNEPGCARFDVIQDRTDPNRFYLYEVYRDAAAEEAHLHTPHFKRWEAATRDWFARPFTLVSGSTLYPPDDAW
jgi:quinol monooxygenase YgiN